VRSMGTPISVAAMMLVIAMPAMAQQTGTRLDRNRGAVGSVSSTDTTSAIIAANVFAQCVARREGKTMRKALDHPFTSAEQSRAIQRTWKRFEGCLGNAREFDSLALSQILSAGGGAEWFVRSELKNVDLSSLDGMTDEAIEKTAFRPRTLLEDLGLCIVRRSPERARALIGTEPTTAAENAAFKAIVPDIGPCVTQGSELKLNTPNLRAVIAYALYRASSKLGATGA
jgi:hypothetical protein